MPTHSNRRQQTSPKNPRNWQVLFEKVWQCFLASVVVCWHSLFPGDICGVSGRSLRGVWGYLSGTHGNWRRFNMFGGYTGSQSLMYGVKTLILAQPWMVRFSVNWPYWDIKIPKPPHISLPKMIGFGHFLQFLGSSERYYLWQLLLIALYQILKIFYLNLLSGTGEFLCLEAAQGGGASAGWW